MAGIVPFLMKDFVLLAASIYLLKQDVAASLKPIRTRELNCPKPGDLRVAASRRRARSVSEHATPTTERRAKAP
jgi:hypothetical protein